MVIEQTMDATRRMLLKQNKIDYDEDKDLFPTEDFDILTLELHIIIKRFGTKQNYEMN